MAITKANLIDSVYEKSELQKQQSTSAVESLLEIMKRTLGSGEDILISGFGKFYVKDKNKRKGRNPHTGNGLILDARRVVNFKCSGVLREKVNWEKERKKKVNFLTEYQKNMGYRYNQPMLRENPPFACGINPLYIVSLIGLSPFFMGSLSWRCPFRPLFIRHRAITMGRIALIANPLNR